MTFKVTITDSITGQPIQGALVGANDEITGQSFLRSTDGEGYADVAMLGAVHIGDRVTLFVLKDGYQQHIKGDALIVTSGDQTLTVALVALRPFEPAFQAAPRVWKGNMCGVRILGLPPVPGGATNPSLVLSWLYPRYNDVDRAKIRVAWKGETT